MKILLETLFETLLKTLMETLMETNWGRIVGNFKKNCKAGLGKL